MTLSIDGATKNSFEYIRENSEFERVIENYKNIIFRNLQGQTRGGSIRILCALQKASLYDYKSMFKLVKSLHCLDNFSLVPVFDYDPNGKTFVSLIPNSQEIKMLHKSIDKSIIEAESNEERQFYQNWKTVSLCWLDEQSINPEKNDAACLVSWYSTYVDAKGRVYPCCYLLNTKHVMGNINEQSFHEIWHGEKYKNFRYQVSNTRSNLSGCNTCTINHNNLLKSLSKLKLFLRI